MMYLLVSQHVSGHHHAHHQENGTKSTAPVVYSTGCVAEDSWRRSGWCALLRNGFSLETMVVGVHLLGMVSRRHHHAHHQENGKKSTAPVVYSTGCVAEDWW
jgi:hypothetical protein